MASIVAPTEASDHRLAAMARIADARDTALAQSNRFLVVGMGSSLIYVIKLVGLRLDLVILGTKVFEIPYGLFAFCLLGMACFIIAQLRFLDGQALDGFLKDTSFRSDDNHVDYYTTFPSKHQWLSPSLDRYGAEGSTAIGRIVFTALGLASLILYSLPLITAAHFLAYWPDLAGENHTVIQWWLVVTFLVSSISVYVFVQYLHISGRN